MAGGCDDEPVRPEGTGTGTWPKEGFTLSLPRVINFKFPLQPNLKYYCTQHEERGFS